MTEGKPSSGRVTPTPSDLQLQMGADNRDAYQLDEDARVQKVRHLLAPLPPGSKILDVGCCDGAILAPLAKTHEVHGVEFCAEFVPKAVARGVRARVHDIAVAPLPYADGEFDAVFSGETIEHVVDTDWFLSEINRVLKLDGTLLLTLPNVRTPVSVGMMVLLGLPPRYSARYRGVHYRDFTLKVGKIALENHGFQIVKITGGVMHIPGLGHRLSALASLFPGWAETIIYLAVKRAKSSYSLKEAVRSEIYR
jgi:SAM-dependent methyltransferase